MSTTKPLDIPRQLFKDAWKLVKCNKGSAGVDGQKIENFEKNLNRNLYKIWNRMSSGSYFPPPVKGVEIPKKPTGKRLLGVPSVSDRIAQTVVKLQLEPIVEPVFLEDSYGYRPRKSAHDAIVVTKKRCWKYNYVLEFDIVKLFDEIRHDLIMKAVRFHTDNKWIILYIERWLKAPFKMPDGSLISRESGIPQGGVVSPILSNLFLHYTFDMWMVRTFPNQPWARYADDGLVHCHTYSEALAIREALENRLSECGLEMHPEKTKIVYCGSRKSPEIPGLEVDFTFLGFSFRVRPALNKKTGKIFKGFLPAVGKKTLKEMRTVIRDKWRLGRITSISLEEIARQINPVIRGWIQYYGAFYRTNLIPLGNYLNDRLARWFRKKYKGLKNCRNRSWKVLGKACKSNPKLFVHWQLAPVC